MGEEVRFMHSEAVWIGRSITLGLNLQVPTFSKALT